MNDDKPKCVICGKRTIVIFNINLERVSICESCANDITVQQVHDLIFNSVDQDND